MPQRTDGYNEEDRQYKVPSLALNLGHALKKNAQILRSEGLIENNSEKGKDGRTFIELYEGNWADTISAGALQTLDTKKQNTFLSQEQY